MNIHYSRYYIFVKPALQNPYVKTYSSLVFSLIAITIFGLFAIRPTVKTIIGLQKSIQEQKQLLVQINQKSKDLSLAKQNYLAINPLVIDQLDELLPVKVKIVELMDDLSVLALVNSLSISGLQFQPIEIENQGELIKPISQVKEIPFVFNIQGSYPNIVSLLDSIGSFSRLISIDSVGFHKPETGDVVAIINARAFYLK